MIDGGGAVLLNLFSIALMATLLGGLLIASAFSRVRTRILFWDPATRPVSPGIYA